MALIIKIDGTTIKNPTTPLQISIYPVTKAGRVASALMTIDFLAEKSTFKFEYDVISYANLNKILAIINNFPTMFHTLTVNENGVEASYTVYPGAVTKSVFRSDNNGYWYFKDVSFSLIEQ